MWPFKPKSETAVSATDAITEGLLARAQAQPPLPEDVASIAACQGVWERCGHSMVVEGDLAPQLQPWLPWVMSCLAHYGNAYFRLTASGRLLPALLANVQGGPDPRSWQYQLTDAAPTEPRTFTVPARDVLHFRIGVEPLAPWRGRSPLARLTASAAAQFEQRLADARPEFAISMDSPLDADDVRQLKQQLERLQRDQLPVVLGDSSKVTPLPRLTDNVTAARRDLAAHVAQSFGLGASFFSDDSQGTERREAWRQFLNGTLAPIASMIERECSAKTGCDTTIDITALRLVDIVSAAKAYASFVDAGLDESEALRRAGLADG